MQLATRPSSVPEPALQVAQHTARLLTALEQSRDLTDVLNLDRQAGALGALARAARLSLAEQNEIAAARVRVQHRAGTLLCQLANEHRPGRAKRARGKAPLRPQLPRGVLERYAISGQDSSNWQALASVPMAQITKRLDELMAAGLEVTSSEFVRRGRASVRKGRNSRTGASPQELRLRAALTNVRRVRALSTAAERELATSILRHLRSWGLEDRSERASRNNLRVDLEHAELTCLLCGREPIAPGQRRCGCGGNWTTALR